MLPYLHFPLRHYKFVISFPLIYIIIVGTYKGSYDCSISFPLYLYVKTNNNNTNKHVHTTDTYDIRYIHSKKLCAYVSTNDLACYTMGGKFVECNPLNNYSYLL